MHAHNSPFCCLCVKNKTKTTNIGDLLASQYAFRYKKKLIKNSTAVNKVCSPSDCEKRCEIQSGGQEMAVMVANGRNFNNVNLVPNPREATQIFLNCCY